MGRVRAHPERDLQNAIWEFLAYHRIFTHVDYQPPGKEQFCRHPSSIGVADILGIFRGQPLAIEVKIKGRKASPAQEAFLNRWNKEGGIGFVAYSIEDVKRKLGL
jgi:hypothetical protein